MANICIIRQAFVPGEPRVGREIMALTEAGHSVDVVCLRRPGERGRDRDGFLTIHRMPMTHRRRGLALYACEYLAFPLMAGSYLAGLHRRRHFDLVQVNTLPDWLVFAAIVPRLSGVPVLVDLHEVMPEFFASKFGTASNRASIRILEWLERASIRFASHAITCTDEMREVFLSRSTSADGITVVMNSADETLFDGARYPARPRKVGCYSLICHGAIEERYGLDTAIRAVNRLRHRIPGVTLEIYGVGTYSDQLRRLVGELGVAGHVTFHGFAPIEQLLTGIANADAGVVAMKPDAYRDLTHCNKMFDLIAMKRPVICSRTKSVMAHFPNGCLQYFDGGDDADLARAIHELYQRPELARQLVHNASVANEPYRWPHQRARYLAVVEGLLASAPTTPIGQVMGDRPSCSTGREWAEARLDSVSTERRRAPSVASPARTR